MLNELIVYLFIYQAYSIILHIVNRLDEITSDSKKKEVELEFK